MTYTTIQGDMFDDIARKTLGSEKYKDAVMRENPDHIGNYIFPAGMTLTIPEIDASESEDALPPWRRAAG